jgi:hypothetical protein
MKKMDIKHSQEYHSILYDTRKMFSESKLLTSIAAFAVGFNLTFTETSLPKELDLIPKNSGVVIYNKDRGDNNHKLHYIPNMYEAIMPNNSYNSKPPVTNIFPIRS